MRVCVFVWVQEAACAYVIALMAVYWCTEALPLAVTALLPTILFPALGIMQSKDVRLYGNMSHPKRDFCFLIIFLKVLRVPFVTEAFFLHYFTNEPPCARSENRRSCKYW